MRLGVLRLSGRTGILVILGLLVLGHGLLLVAGSFERSADGWIHLFFADHWQRSWWNDWEPRWNDGFSLFAYPPLAHQILALLGWLFGWPLAGTILQGLSAGLLIWGLYRLGRCWFEAEDCWLIAILASSLSSLAISLHVFGQLPNLLSLALILHALPFCLDWLVRGEQRALLLTVLLALSGALSNLYAGVFGFLLLGLPVLFEAGFRDMRATFRRGAVLLVSGLIPALALLSPAIYFQQVYRAHAAPVFHSSQANVLALTPFNWFMFYGLYGVYLIAVPFWLLTLRRRELLWRFGPSLLLLFGLSLGGTTPVARGLLGPLFDALTFDRFGQWNSLLLTLLLAPWAVALWKKSRWRPLLAGLAVMHLAAGVYSATSPWWGPAPTLRRLEPLIAWMQAEDRPAYRYLTLGLQRPNFSRLSTLLVNPSVDGNFPFGRNQALLNDSGIASLDDARLYGDRGWQILDRVLDQAQEQHLKYILVADPVYEPWLLQRGWHAERQLAGVRIWQREDILPLSAPSPLPSPLPLRLIWALGPLAVASGLALVLVWQMFLQRRMYSYRPKFGLDG